MRSPNAWLDFPDGLCYPWRFSGADIERRRLPVGDYAMVRDDRVVAAVERKTPPDLATAAVGGRLGLALAELAQDWAYRWLAAASRVESSRAIPLLDERALGESELTYNGRPRLQDASARRMLITEEARAGTA